MLTTSKLLQEAWEHEWAMNFQGRHPVTSMEFLQAALVKGTYKQNLLSTDISESPGGTSSASIRT